MMVFDAWMLGGDGNQPETQRSTNTKKDPLVVRIPSLKLTAKAPENGWLEDEFPFGMA